MPGDAVSYDLAEGRYAYVAPARGVIIVNGQRLETGDGVALASERRLDIRAEAEAEIVLVDAGPAPVAAEASASQPPNA
jgi:redox-sensitive bicupin YhaK (pirin superfamily)